MTTPVTPEGGERPGMTDRRQQLLDRLAALRADPDLYALMALTEDAIDSYISIQVKLAATLKGEGP